MSDQDRMKLEDYRREISRQIEEERHLEQNALSIFRLLIGSLSILATVATVVIFRAENTSIPVGSLDLTDFREGLAEIGLISEPLSFILTIILIGIAFIGTFLGLLYLFIGAPLGAYNVLQPRSLRASIERLPEEKEFSDVSGLEAYRQLMKHNQEELDKIAEHWEDCYSSIGLGIVLLSSGLAASAIMYINPGGETALISIFVIIMVFSTRTIRAFPMDKASRYVETDVYSDTFKLLITSLMLLFILVDEGISLSIIQYFILILIGIMTSVLCYFMLRLSEDLLEILTKRDLALMLGGLVLSFILVILNDLYSADYLILLVLFVSLSSLTLFITGSFQAGVYIATQLHDPVSEKIVYIRKKLQSIQSRISDR